VSEHVLSAARDCFQCQKCSAGCPVAPFMDFKPHQVIQMVNLGRIAPLLASHAIWICASCYTCSTRCPNEIDVAGVFDELRRRSVSEKTTPAETGVRLFHQAFLSDIRTYGRVHELSMMARYKLATRRYLDDARLGWLMFLRGKLKLLPSIVKSRRAMARLFAENDR
jgi:heterodisulfide reductase subunit C2